MNELASKPLLVACPNCGTELLWDSRNKYRPFCSERCKLIDLGLWAAEDYRVAGESPTEEPASVTVRSD